MDNCRDAVKKRKNQPPGEPLGCPGFALLPMKNKLPLYFLTIPLGFLALFYFLPLARILALGLGSPWQASAGANVSRIADVVAFTLLQAGASAGLTLLLGIPAGYLFYRYDFPYKKLLYLATAVPFMLPTVVVASGFNGLLGPSGVFNWLYKLASGQPQPLFAFTGTLWAIFAAHVFYNATIVIRMVRGSLERQDPSLEYAARTLGASPIRAFVEITLPRLLPAIIVSAFFVFFFDFTSFGVVLMLGGSKFATLEVEIFTQTMRFLNLPFAAVLSLVQILFTLAFSLLYGRLLAGAGDAPSQRIRWATARLPVGQVEKIAVRTGILLVAAFFTLPVIALPIRSFTSFESVLRGGGLGSLFTLDHYLGLFSNPRDSYFYVPPAAAIQNSLLFGAGAVLLSILIGLPTALLLSRRRWLQRWAEPVFVLPLGTSSVTLGLGYILFFNVALPGGQNLLTSPWLLPFAHTAIALPFVIRNLLSALDTIPQSYYEAAKVLGASGIKTLTSIDLPLLRRPLVSSAAFAFTISLGEFGATSLLARPEYPTLPTAIYRLISQPGAANYGQAMAMSTLLFALCAVAISFIEQDSRQGF